MNIEFIYQLLGMKEVELTATRTARDQLKKENEALKKEIKALKDTAD